jgi:hypothetical protein
MPSPRIAELGYQTFVLRCISDHQQFVSNILSDQHNNARFTPSSAKRRKIYKSLKLNDTDEYLIEQDLSACSKTIIVGENNFLDATMERLQPLGTWQQFCIG